MLYFIFLTRRCNLVCTYCGQSNTPTDSMVQEITYSMQDLLKFLKLDPDPIIAFYGGEPLLNIEKLLQIMNRLPHAKFLIQTNGLHLNKVPWNFLNQVNSILVSIDGTAATTDYYRGRSIYRKIITNVNEISKRGFSGDLIARMTISTHTDIFKDVTHLLLLENPHFDHIHWQLDMIWSDKTQYGDLNNWIRNYNKGITQLVDLWMEKIRNEQFVFGIVPFIGITSSLLKKTKSSLRCGAGLDAFAIQTDGSIYACPVCPEFKDFKVGSIYTSKPSEIENSMSIKPPCLECEEYLICGGRCLFTNHHNFWGEDFHLVCSTVKHLINELKRIEPEIRQMIKEKILLEKQFNYPEFNNSCEIIP
ncbi:MAG: TIGR04084 family radical SAM/SPASM domain-containing protein [Candidatus Heimdallarchaeota archaeon]|nr:TIGR04084 family radical SAM/SPASM domain-containing protein [Candidatus Heimdallarchaeota archaeon]